MDLSWQPMCLAVGAHEDVWSSVEIPRVLWGPSGLCQLHPGCLFLLLLWQSGWGLLGDLAQSSIPPEFPGSHATYIA